MSVLTVGERWPARPVRQRTGPARADVTAARRISYADGSVVQAPLAFADWYFNDPGPGTDIVAMVAWSVPPENADQNHWLLGYGRYGELIIAAAGGRGRAQLLLA